MNRREALQSLMALPGVASVKVDRVRPEDVIVVELDEHYTSLTMKRIEEDVQRVWPGHKVIVLDKGVSIRIARACDAEAVRSEATA